MGRFTILDDAAIAAIAAGFGLGPVVRWTALEGGTINSNFDVACAGGRWLVRINEGKAEADVAYEAELIAALAAAGVRTPEARRARDGRPYLVDDGRLVSAFPWVDGGHRPAREVTPADAGAVGRELARLHLAGLPLAARFARESVYTTPRIAERLGGFEASSDPALAAAIPLLRQELDWLAARAAERAAVPTGLIHGDLFRDNVMFRGAELVALIDFEQASSGSLVYDLAVCLNAWCYVDGLVPALIRAMIASYDAVRPLGEDERALLGVEARAAAARFTVTRITDVYLAASGVPDKDFRRYLARVLAWRTLSGGAAALFG